ncbi:MAG TPA: prepilin-type N-terminal cleavage/methylation domain-containing protein [Gemmataceae bacterium]
MTTVPNRRRAGFTLVEMLVASALIIFMMYIIASAFESGLVSFRVLKQQGDMQEKLRAATTVLRTDLASPHFGGHMSPLTQGPSLADHRLNDQTWTPPQQGYFRISLPPYLSQKQPLAYMYEGVDPENTSLQYYRIADPRALYLQFTVNLTDGHPAVRDARGRRDQFFTTDAVGAGGMSPWGKPDYTIADTALSSTWAEVTYFLQQQPNQFANGDQTVPLFTLYRRQKMLVEPNPTAASWVSNPPNSNDPLVRRLSPADPSTPARYAYPLPYPVRTFPRFLNELGEIDRDFPDIGSWFTGQTGQTGQAPYGYAFNSPSDVTEPARRWGMSRTSSTTGTNPPWTNPNLVPPPLNQPPAAPQNAPATFGLPQTAPFNTVLNEAQLSTPANPYADPKLGQRVGGDVLLTDVVNFEVKVLWEPIRLGATNTDKFVPPQVVNNTPVIPPDFMEPSPFVAGVPPAQGGTGNPDYPFDLLPVGVNAGFAQDPTTALRVLDTWSSNNDPYSPPPPFDYYYGVPPIVPNPAPTASSPNPLIANPNLTLASSLADPTYANWNANHFVNGLAQKNPTRNIPLRVRVRALQIKLRIWDKKSNQTRQVTIIQDL